MHLGQGARCSPPLVENNVARQACPCVKMPKGGRGMRAHARIKGPAGPETPAGPDRGSGPWYEAESAPPVHVRRAPSLEGCPVGLSKLRA